MSLTLDSPLAEVPNLPPRVVKILGKEGVTTVEQVLLESLPFRHEDRRHMESPALHAGEAPSCHHIRILKCSTKYFGRGRGGGMFEAETEPLRGGGMGAVLTLRWWNMPFMNRALAEGQELIVFGRIKESKGRLIMDHPEYEVMGDDETAVTIHTGRITPIYRLRGGATQKALRAAAWWCLAALPEALLPDVLPSQGEDRKDYTRVRAVREAHFPGTYEALEQARRYLALEEFYLYQLRVVRRRRVVLEAGGHAQAAGELAAAFERALPFTLTPAQRRALEEIRRDMAAQAPMNRLLHGDVGSGKTVVALAAMLGAVEGGRQAALMAPTQILAEQHFGTACTWLEPLGVRVALRTANRREERGADLFSPGATAAEGAQVVIGTHALLHDGDLLQNAGMVVIDEQHKFGVAQRSLLIRRGQTPDVLVMTATPIPRTLSLTLYGDLDVSTLDERPRERGKVITRVRPASRKKEAAVFLRQQLDEGRQGYLVFPLIEESEKLDITAAKQGYEEWSQVLAPHPVALLHGKLSAEDKEMVMRKFRAGEVKALVATTVIEVGVDVPNATVMYIHHAERFGLAQLHQLRGRIGRGRETSYCVLFAPDKDAEVAGRLAILEETTDGFRISEEDLRRRGPGDVLGRAQSGQAPLKFAELLADTRLLMQARQLAEQTFETDPELRSGRLAPVRDFIFAETGADTRLQ